MSSIIKIIPGPMDLQELFFKYIKLAKYIPEK